MLLFSLMFSSGCSVNSKFYVTQAAKAVEQARAAGADERAPYEYYKASYFLYKAKEEWGTSNYAAAKEFAAEAKQSAEAASKKSKDAPWQGSPADRDKTPGSMKDNGLSNKMLGVEE